MRALSRSRSKRASSSALKQRSLPFCMTGLVEAPKTLLALRWAKTTKRVSVCMADPPSLAMHRTKRAANPSGSTGIGRAQLAGVRQVDRRGGPFYGPANFAGGLCQRAAPPRFQPRWMACYEDQEFTEGLAQAPSEQPRGAPPRAPLRHKQDQPALQGAPGLVLSWGFPPNCFDANRVGPVRFPS
jgi:hypothetical protein